MNIFCPDVFCNLFLIPVISSCKKVIMFLINRIWKSTLGPTLHVSVFEYLQL